ncbi:PREDICTED: probable F-box protein At1g65740-like [Fragaria vesca subsp. vesca]
MDSLPMHLLELVIEGLTSFSDFVHFSVVCKSWYFAAKDHYNRRTMLVSSCHHPPPMLMICSDEEDTWNLYDFMNNKLLGMQVNVPSKRFCASKGWLIAMDKNFAVTLIRVKGRREKENSVIYLPPLTIPEGREAKWSADCDKYVFKASISADPILSVNDCIVTIIYRGWNQLAFIRLGKDNTWNYISEDRCIGTHFEEVVHAENKIYAVDYLSKLWTIDITSQCHEDDVKLVADGGKPSDYYVKSYLVDSSGEKELLMVRRYYYHGVNNNKRVTKKFKVYELDFNGCRWVEKRTLRDVALFLGDNSSISVPASKFPGCLPNCIYFTHDDDDVGREYEFFHDFGVYDVKNKRFLSVDTTHAATLVKKSKRPSIWVLPTFQL